MKLEFQEDLLKFLAQAPDGKKYLEYIEPDLFDLDTQSIICGLLKAFTTKYKKQPNLPALLEYFSIEVRKQKEAITNEVKKQMEEAIRDAYESFTGSTEFIKEVVLEKYQIKRMKELITDSSDKLKTGGSDLIKSIFTKMTEIKQLGDADMDEEENNKGNFLLADHVQGKYSIVEGHSTYLKALNRLTSTMGFYSPQLVVLMGAPKSFKTGTSLNIALNYVLDGYKVYIADCENGQNRVLDRVRQCMLECTWAELISGEFDDTLSEMVERYKVMGGDLKCDFYPANTKTISDVEAELDRLRTEDNWVPDIIFYDYLDLFRPIDYRIKEKRLQIQAVYFDAIRLQKKRNLIGFTPSQVGRNAVNKEIIDMGDFAEDFGKAANAHAAFALCATDDEKEANIMRIIPVAQRDGVAQSSNMACFVEVDHARMRVREITAKEWNERRQEGRAKLVSDGRLTEGLGKKSRTRRGTAYKNIKDE